MPFKAKMKKMHTDHIKKMGEELGITIQRADDIFEPKPFIEKVWNVSNKENHETNKK